MNKLKENSFLSALVVFGILGALLFGFLIFKGLGEYKKSKAAFDGKAREYKGLLGQQPLPTDENLAKTKDTAEGYSQASGVLRKKMLAAQAEFRDNIDEPKFMDNVRRQLAEFVAKADAAGCTVPEEFYLGMDEFRTAVPEAKACNQLNYQLEATRFALDLMIDSGVTNLLGLGRKRLGVELDEVVDPKAKGKKAAGKPDPAAAVQEVYPMELAFSGPYEGVYKYLNALANNNEYYFVIKYPRIENAVQEGPEREEPGEGGEATENKGNFILGSEDVKVYLRLDLVRLKRPGLVEAP